MAITTQTEQIYRGHTIYSKTDSSGNKYSYGSDIDNITYTSIDAVRAHIDAVEGVPGVITVGRDVFGLPTYGYVPTTQPTQGTVITPSQITPVPRQTRPAIEQGYKPLPSQEPIPMSTCTKGQVVPAVLGAKFLGCGEGYTFVPAATTDIFNTGYCVCNEYLKSQEGQAWAQNIKGQGQEAGQSLTTIVTYLPYLIIGAIIIAVLGMFKK